MERQTLNTGKPKANVAPLLSVPALLLRRKCACGGSAGSGSACNQCMKRKLQRKTSAARGPSTAPPIVHDVLNSSGQVLDAGTRSFMEPRFGHSFASVRVHADERAAQSARLVHALAYTVGSHVVFDQGQYQPHTRAGQELLAHELTHVVQQGDLSAPPSHLALGNPADAHEKQADQIAARVVDSTASTQNHGARPRVSSMAMSGGTPLVQRKVPTGISLKENHPFGHADFKNDDDKEKILTSIGNVSLMQLLPAGDYSAEQQRGECTKEFLTEVANTCPASAKPFCSGDRCLQVNQFGSAGDAKTGTMVKDGPDCFIDRHIDRQPDSFLKGSGKSQCSVVCHQMYKYRTVPDKQLHDLGAFYIIRNFKTGTYTPKSSTTALDITTGNIQKVPAASAAPTKDVFAKDVAPGLVKSGALLDAPPVPKPQPAPTGGQEKK